MAATVAWSTPACAPPSTRTALRFIPAPDLDAHEILGQIRQLAADGMAAAAMGPEFARFAEIHRLAMSAQLASILDVIGTLPAPAKPIGDIAALTPSYPGRAEVEAAGYRSIEFAPGSWVLVGPGDLPWQRPFSTEEEAWEAAASDYDLALKPWSV